MFLFPRPLTLHLCFALLYIATVAGRVLQHLRLIQLLCSVQMNIQPSAFGVNFSRNVGYLHVNNPYMLVFICK